MTASSKKRFNVRSMRRKQLLKKKLKVNGKEDIISLNSTSSTTIAGSLASALSLGLISVPENRGRDLRTELKNHGIQGVDTKLLRELGEDNIDQAIIGEEIAQLSEEYDLHAITWRQRMVHFLHTMPVEVFMMSLVVLDVLIILSMVVLDMYILEEKLDLLGHKGSEILTNLNQTWPDITPGILSVNTIDESYKIMLEHINVNNTEMAEQIKLLSDSDTTVPKGHTIHKRATGAVSKPKEEHFGEDHTYKAAKMIYDSTKVNHILHYCSIAILAVFVVEVGLKIIGYGKSYFTNKWELIDGIVIIISFSLDIAVTDANFTHEVGKTVLVVFLMWRVIRILNAMVLTSRARTMFRLRVLRKSKRIAEDKNKQLTSEVADLQAEVKRLRALAKSYGADEHEIVSAQVLSKTSVSSTKAGLKNMMAQLLHLNTKIATGLNLGSKATLNVSSSGSGDNVSCSSLNKLNPNGYNRARRPSMIGDQTMCHDPKSPTSLQPETDTAPMRQRASSDAGGMTRLTRKLRDSLAELKKKRSSGKISQGGSTPSVFEMYEEPPEIAEAARKAECHATVIDETAEPDQTTAAEPKTEKPRSSTFTRNDSGVVIVHQNGEENKSGAPAEHMTSIDSGVDTGQGHTNMAFVNENNNNVENDSGNSSEGDVQSANDQALCQVNGADVSEVLDRSKAMQSPSAEKSADRPNKSTAPDVESTSFNEEPSSALASSATKVTVTSAGTEISCPESNLTTDGVPTQPLSNGTSHTIGLSTSLPKSESNSTLVASSPSKDLLHNMPTDDSSTQDTAPSEAANPSSSARFLLPQISLTSADDYHTVLL